MKPIIVNEEADVAREILYVKIKTENKEWVTEQAELGGFKNLYDFMDALIESLKDPKARKAS